MSLRCILLSVVPIIVFSATYFAKNVEILKKSNIPEAGSPINYRLPSDVVPILYTIDLEPNIIPGNFTLAGESRIDIQVKNVISEIVLHAKNLKFEENHARLSMHGEPVANVTLTFAHDNVTDFYKIKLSKTISPGNYTLQLKYTGSLSDIQSDGFYVSSYENAENEEIWMASTLFEPNHAREAFPCFDEPALKARFKISIKHFKNYTAFSNMPETNGSMNGDTLKRWTTFEVTPVMSTYLVAFIIVTDFDCQSSANGTFRVCSRKNTMGTQNFVERVGPPILKHLENYTGILYGLPKIDYFVVPEFNAGAVENWGIISYGEGYFPSNDRPRDVFYEQQAMTIVAHETAHQWFGNLVSPSWWSFLWLNEGFAEYFGYFIAHKIEPSWFIMDQFVMGTLQENVFVTNDNDAEYLIEPEVNNSDDVTGILYRAEGVYSEAASVIRMFSHALKETTFQSGLRKYLEKHAYSVANSNDLFESLQEVAGKRVGVNLIEAFTSWVRQPGHPVVTVIRNYSSGEAIISQTRFLMNRSKKPEKLWYIPLNFASEDELDFENTTAMQWMSETTRSIKGLSTDKWVIFNRQQTGRYRVNYDNENWRLLANYLKDPHNINKIHLLNRAQLLDDSFNLAQAGELSSYLPFLKLSEYLQHEDNYAPWRAARRAFSTLDRALWNTTVYHRFQLYGRRLVRKLVQTVGYETLPEDNHSDVIRRSDVITFACTLGYGKCLRFAYDNIDEISRFPVNIGNAVLCMGLRSADAQKWESVEKTFFRYGKSESDAKLLSCSSDPVTLKNFLEASLFKTSEFSRDDVFKAVCSGSPIGINVALSFIIDNHQAIIKRDNNTDFIVKCLKHIAQRMTTANQLKQLETFVTSLPEDSGKLAEALKKAETVDEGKKNVARWEKHVQEISEFLNAQQLVEDDSSSFAMITSSVH